MKKNLIDLVTSYPKLIIILSIAAAIGIGLFIPRIKIDTDPENMLSEDTFVRRFHHEVKQEFDLYDFLILGIVNDEDAHGIFNIDSLTKIYEITEKIKLIDGVIARNIISPSTTDSITQAGLGAVEFKWLMAQPPKTQEEALQIRDEAKNNPMLNNTLISEDGHALALYIPIKSKDMSYRISKEIQKIASGFSGNEQYHITGLPVAEDTFGVEMFRQMAISAPMAGLIIFIMLWMSFRKISVIIAPMVLAMMTVIITMGLLIGFGFTVHIMSSMIPIFLMPISVVDSVHILSEFYDHYPRTRDKRKTISQVMHHLFSPMLYTSLTTMAGFMSLALTPIPPVQVFGVFVSIGVGVAWLLTMTFIPAYTLLLPEKSLQNFGIREHEEENSVLAKFLKSVSSVSVRFSKLLIAFFGVLIVFSIIGIMKININDNPVKWFRPDHPIRVADVVLNEHFGGTYTAYLVLKGAQEETFKQPEMLNYISALDDYLVQKGDVGKATTLADVVKKIYSELLEGNPDYYRIPDSPEAVAQCLISFQNSHKPDDLWHLTTPDYNKVNIWIQLKSGDNQDMERVVGQVEEYIKQNQPPIPFEFDWAGLTFINTVWQDRMVGGMLNSLLGSFVMVFVMMAFLFRSALWGFLAMVPLSITIALIYGLIGWIGKDYDMPTAVLSSLTLGLSVDFAIHFLERTREIHKKFGSWMETNRELFGSSGRAISRNALVIAIGFTPLMLAPLVPYKTVGFFMMAIMFCSAFVTLFALPALITVLQKRLFVAENKGILCKWCSCFVMLAVAVFGIAYTTFYWNPFKFVSMVIVLILAITCRILSQRKACKISTESEEKKGIVS
ncbi:MAG: RND transporter [Candidatus Auribacter fodinae]|jgi:predicted RND superfamily exporter protein|uniref:RND transporter n=1 Tax=Candidatus Auribacter fodinae TaxID=2093366 RepID=A0A3A4QVN5_9BACT|nr:MAG: RND transporter [Candidatus Auribacter fodinae]